MVPEFSSDYLVSILDATSTTLKGEAFEVLFNDNDFKKVNQSKDADNVAESAVNFMDQELLTLTWKLFMQI